MVSMPLLNGQGWEQTDKGRTNLTCAYTRWDNMMHYPDYGCHDEAQGRGVATISCIGTYNTTAAIGFMLIAAVTVIRYSATALQLFCSVHSTFKKLLIISRHVFGPLQYLIFNCSAVAL